MLYKLLNQTDAFPVTTDSWTISGWQEATARKASLFLSRACPALQIMHRISAPRAVPHQKVSGTFWQLHRGITTMLLNTESVNDPAQLADRTDRGRTTFVCEESPVMLFGQGRAWSTSAAELNIAGNSSAKPAQLILKTIINTTPRDSIFSSNICTKMPGFKPSGPLQIFYPKTLWPNRKAHPG